MRKFINFIIILKYWDEVVRASEIVTDPTSKYSTLVAENLTLEELDGLTDTERIGRFLSMPTKTLVKDFKHLQKCLKIKR